MNQRIRADCNDLGMQVHRRPATIQLRISVGLTDLCISVKRRQGFCEKQNDRDVHQSSEARLTRRLFFFFRSETWTAGKREETERWGQIRQKGRQRERIYCLFITSLRNRDDWVEREEEGGREDLLSDLGNILSPDHFITCICRAVNRFHCPPVASCPFHPFAHHLMISICPCPLRPGFRSCILIAILPCCSLSRNSFPFSPFLFKAKLTLVNLSQAFSWIAILWGKIEANPAEKKRVNQRERKRREKDSHVSRRHWKEWENYGENANKNRWKDLKVL